MTAWANLYPIPPCLFNYMNICAEKMRSAIIPKTTPLASIIPTIMRFSLGRLLIFIRIRSPTPAPENSPAIMVPTVIIPFVQRVVRPTETAQFGINPTIAAIKWLTKGMLNKAEPRFSSPTKKIRVLIATVVIKIKSEIVAVWWSAEDHMPLSQWQLSSSQITSILIFSCSLFVRNNVFSF